MNFERLLAGRIGSFILTGLGLVTVTLMLYRYNLIHFNVVRILCFREIDESPWIWLAWPVLAGGSISNHINNVRTTRSTPAISATLMAFYSGCLGASASMTLILQRISKDTGIPFERCFLILTVCYGYVRFQPGLAGRLTSNIRDLKSKSQRKIFYEG